MSGLECLAISIRGSNSSKAQTVHSILLSNFFRVDFPSCAVPPRSRSEEHTSELQSQPNLVCRLLLEKNIVQRTYETFTEAARIHFGGSLKGKFVLTAGLGGMGRAQPTPFKCCSTRPSRSSPFSDSSH